MLAARAALAAKFGSSGVRAAAARRARSLHRPSARARARARA